MLKKIFEWIFGVEKEKEEDIKWIRITSNENEHNFWYKFKQGYHYPVIDYNSTTYQVVSEDKEILFVDKCHAVIENV